MKSPGREDAPMGCQGQQEGLIWAQVVMTRPRMMKVCEKCGAFHEKDQS
ncbi:MAG: hypothetical protein HYV46_10460 [candidate division NC10 bacterium]|nr:hypothetical protein [candidate division NC10 bacterium]